MKDLVREIDAQCGGILGFDDAGNGAWKEALREGKRVILTTTLEDLPVGEDERRSVLADNGMLPLPSMSHLLYPSPITIKTFGQY